MKMLAMSLLFGLTLAVFVNTVTSQSLLDKCIPANNAINKHKEGVHIDISTEKLKGLYNFVYVYDPTSKAKERNDAELCLKSEYSKKGESEIVDVQSTLTAWIRDETKTVARIYEEATKSADASYWTMSGRMSALNILGQVDKSADYIGDFNFFHEKDGILGYSACSVKTNGEKGVVLIISAQGDITESQLLDPNSAAYKSKLEAKNKLEAIAKDLPRSDETPKQGLPVDDYLYELHTNCWGRH